VVLKAAMNVLQTGLRDPAGGRRAGPGHGVLQWRSSQENSGLKVLKWVAALPTYGASLLVPSGRTEFSSIEASVTSRRRAAAPGCGSAVLEGRGQEGRRPQQRARADAQLYQSLLARFDKAVFLQKEGL